MLTIRAETVIQADLMVLWRAWKPDLPIGSREEESRNLNLYPLAYGLKIPVTLVAVEERNSWTLEHHLPAGKLVIEHRLAPAPGRGVLASQTYEVRGPMSVAYRLLAPGIRSTARAALADLARTAAASA